MTEDGLVRYVFDSQVPLPEGLLLTGKFREMADKVGLIDPQGAFEDFKKQAKEKSWVYRDWSTAWGKWLIDQKSHDSIGEKRLYLSDQEGETEETLSKKKKASLPSIGFSFASGEFLNLDDSVRKWEMQFPGVDVRGEILKAAQWVSKTGTQKTSYRRFIEDWLRRAGKQGMVDVAPPVTRETVPAMTSSLPPPAEQEVLPGGGDAKEESPEPPPSERIEKESLPEIPEKEQGPKTESMPNLSRGFMILLDSLKASSEVESGKFQMLFSLFLLMFSFQILTVGLFLLVFWKMSFFSL